MNLKNWEVLPLNKEQAISIAQNHGLPSILAMLLQVRGFTKPEQINDLLGRSSEFADPFLLKDMDKAADRIRTALEEYEKIAIFGDYDADGVTSTSILYTYLEKNGADVMWYIPKREGEGYGMNIAAIDYLHEQGVKLIVTVDNGIASIKEIAHANSLGIDTVVTDHHRPHDILPEAVAVVDPYIPGNEGLEFRDYCGAAIAFKLVQAIESEFGDPEELINEYADLASIGIIGDIVPLLGENRSIVRTGLRMLVDSERAGIRSLIEKSGNTERRLTSTSVAFTIVPRINATGRMGDSDRAVRLLITDDPDEADDLSEAICNDNTERRNVEAQITESVIDSIENDDSIKYARVIVVGGKGWHHGVVGIVAARITERYGKPCMIIAENGNESKGSGRSVEGFNLFEAITYCDDLLIKYGGHPMAAGITLTPENISVFRDKINEYAAMHHPIMPAQRITVDMKLLPSALSPAIPESLSIMEPFGASNPSPLFGLYNMKLEGISPVGGGNHLRLTFSRGESTVTCMKFSMDEKSFPFVVGDVLDLAVTLESKLFKGSQTLTVQIKEMKISGQDMSELISSLRVYEKYKLHEGLTPREKAAMLPARDDFAELYRFLRASGWKAGLTSLLSRLSREGWSYAKLRLCLDVLVERKLIAETEYGEASEITVLPTQGKTDIFASPILSLFK
ncbi:MAG: single-stranded-DNA-specific exonuclease RecJ [Clostridia bacterium]|nr:single-stranded-DNA-specific exonuclease RecJ [Clostridia bacterium]